MLILARRVREHDRILIGSERYKVISKNITRKSVQILVEKEDRPDIKFTWVTHLNNKVKLLGE